MSVAVKLEIFEGPLDLLLHLIRKNEVDIQDIPVALITKQYLEYLDMMREMNIGVAGEFLVMAATLTQIKSKMLLPSFDKSDLEGDEDDPRVDLVAQLKEHLRIKAAAQELDRRPRVGRDVFQRDSGKAEVEQAAAQDQQGIEIQAGIFDLVSAFRRLMQNRNQNLELALPTDNISLEDRMSQLLEMLKLRRSLTFEEFFSGMKTRSELVVTFLALLELTRLGLMKVFQSRLEPAGGAAAWGTLRMVYTPEGAMEPEGDAGAVGGADAEGAAP
jgi:segregation and condensation protein A